MTALSRRGASGNAGRIDQNTNTDYVTTTCMNSCTTTPRSTEMYAMNEALARERMREVRHRAQRHRVASELAAASRWQRVELRARAAQRRHAQRAERAADASAVAVAQSL